MTKLWELLHRVTLLWIFHSNDPCGSAFKKNSLHISHDASSLPWWHLQACPYGQLLWIAFSDIFKLIWFRRPLFLTSVAFGLAFGVADKSHCTSSDCKKIKSGFFKYQQHRHTSWPQAKCFPVQPSHSVNKYIVLKTISVIFLLWFIAQPTGILELTCSGIFVSK